MSEDSKFFAKPRVRFSQTTNIKENSEDLSNKKTVVKRNLPKIKNITSVKTPVKILSFKKQSDNAINTNIFPSDDTIKKESVIINDNTRSLPKKKNDYALQDQLICKTDDKESLTNSYDIENLRTNNIKQASTVSEKSPHKNIPDIIPCLTVPATINNKDLHNALKPKNDIVTNISKQSIKSKLDEGKENKNSYVKRASRLVTDKKVVKPLCSKTSHIKKEANVAEMNVKKSNFTKHDRKNVSKPCISNIEKQAKKTVGTYTKHPWKNSSTKSTTVNLMPCHKYTKVLMKNKTSPVKKFIVHDIVVPNVKAYIASGIPKKQSNFDIHQIDKGANMRSNITPSEKLLHPEYNSIACIATKLNEAKKEKIVTDIEHLPATYKNLINGKTSSALDFPLNEIIYKNLVDLSINEKQFPCKIMRSRDPQPRQKDLVPKLSDFFTPQSTEEYYTSMNVKPRNLDIIESWNAFRISDKICEWKDNVDN